MFVSQYVCLVAFTLLYLVSSLNTECSAFDIPDYISSHFTRRIARQSCEFRCLNGQCIYRDQHCDGKSDCLDNFDEYPEICDARTPSVPPPTLSDDSCTLPPQPDNGKYTIDRSSTLLTYSCSPGYQIYPSSNNNVAVCHFGKWYPNLSECVRTCGPRISDTVNTYCEHNGIAVDCSKPMIEGTTVRMNCKHLYLQMDSSANPVSVCKGGSWDYAFIECVPGQTSTPRDDSCTLPPQPANGNYTVQRSQSLIKLTYSCSPGYQIYPFPNNNVAVCESGKWYPGLCECLRLCEPRISESVDTDCEHNGIAVDCSKSMVEGTMVRMNCKHSYSQVDSSANRASVCKDGSWDYALIACVPGQMSTPRDDSCTLPPQPANGKYTLDRSSTMYKLTYSCSPEYQIYPFPNNNVAICYSGKWYPGLSECVRLCGPRISDSVETYCEHTGIKVDCSKPMIEGTTVRMNCKHLYSQVNSSANSVSVCRDGSWDNTFIKCVQDCGNVVPEGDLFIIGGDNVKKGTFPWHVGVYRLNNTNQFEQKCGGSIISRKVILSAAHCFTNDANGALYDVKQYAIAAGKYYRNYYDERDTLSQTSTIKEIIIPFRYQGIMTRFTADIAFVILDKAFDITHVVQPVCIDWDLQYEVAQLKDNNIGTVVGWGYTKEGKDPSAELKQLSVPFINFETCVVAVPENFIRYLTRDKFCAGFTNGSSVCNGDTGGGLAFLLPGDKKYFLHGLLSVSPVIEGTCDSRQYGVYTRVSDYMATLRSVEVNTRV